MEELPGKPGLMKKYDFSNGSTNTYLVEKRHGLIPPCVHCGEGSEVLLDGSDYYRFFVKGEGYVQEVFPYLSAAQRELLVTGIHPDCWNTVFGPSPEGL
jgi:hypothetical protein